MYQIGYHSLNWRLKPIEMNKNYFWIIRDRIGLLLSCESCWTVDIFSSKHVGLDNIPTELCSYKGASAIGHNKI